MDKVYKSDNVAYLKSKMGFVGRLIRNNIMRKEGGVDI